MAPKTTGFKTGHAARQVSGASGGGGLVPGIEMAALILSAIWLLAATLVFVVQGTGMGEGVLGFALTVLVIFLPAAMIWIAAIAARTASIIRQESASLHAAIEGVRDAIINQSKTQQPQSSVDMSVARKLDEIAAAQRKTETALATFSSTRPLPAAVPPARAAVARPAAKDETQVALPLDTRPEDLQPPLERGDFIRALNFPETAGDKTGFASLRRALKDRQTAQLIQAAQDVLTLLSQDGIYMDDLPPDMARPEIWRNFAGGARGRAIAALGGIRDRSSLALAATRMKNDPIFRDAAHHFLRRFDQMFSSFAETADDNDISDLSNTRTARAFMLLGRVAGTFD